MGAGTSGDLRAANRATALGALVVAGELSRAELAERCGLSVATATAVVAELVAAGLVEERGRVPSRGGRPIGRLGVRADGALLLGVHVADDDVAVELVDLSLTRLDGEEVPLGVADPSPVHVAAALRRAVRAVWSRRPDARDRLLGVGLGLPGSLGRPASDVVRAGVPGAAALAETLLHVPGLGWPAAPVVPANRAGAVAAAELWRGGLDAAGRTLVVALGRDVSLAVVDRGLLDPVGAGEWGHTAVVPNGRRCRCGRRGCLEAYVGGDALVEAWRTRGGEPDGDGPTALASLLAAADEGDGAAVTALDMALDLMAGALGAALVVTGATAVVVGGWAGEALVRARGPALAARVRAATAAPGADLIALTGPRAPGRSAFGAALLALGLVARPRPDGAGTEALRPALTRR